MQKHALDQVFHPMPAQDVMIDAAPLALPTREISFLHYHDRYEIGLCLSGSGIFMTQQLAQVIRAGDLLFFPPGVRHYSRSIDRCMCRFVYLRTNAVPERLSAQVPPVLREGDAAYEELMGLMRQVDRTDAQRRLCLLLSLFLLEANAVYPSAEHSSVSEPMAEYLALHYNRPLCTREMAAHFHLSESQLRRRFAACHGLSPMAYRHRLRCRIGRELLMHTERTVSEVAEHLGYASPSDFYRQFQKQYHIPPSRAKKEDV